MNHPYPYAPHWLIGGAQNTCGDRTTLLTIDLRATRVTRGGSRGVRGVLESHQMASGSRSIGQGDQYWPYGDSRAPEKPPNVAWSTHTSRFERALISEKKWCEQGSRRCEYTSYRHKMSTVLLSTISGHAPVLMGASPEQMGKSRFDSISA